MAESRMAWKRFVQQDVLLLLLATFAGIAGAMLAARYLAARAAESQAAMSSRYALRQVVVAAQDLPRGLVLTAGSLAARAMPAEFVPADAVAPEGAAGLLGTRTAIPIRRGTPLAMAAVQHAGAGRLLSSALAAGERALTIAVDESGSQAGALRPGDHVDLYYSRTVSGDSLQVPLIQHVEILQVGSSAGDGTDEALPAHFATITLRVDESTAPQILLAQQAGQVDIVLRSPGDEAISRPVVRNSRDLMRSGPPVAVSTRAGLELLVGGNGGRTPDRVWLQVGRAVERAGEAT